MSGNRARNTRVILTLFGIVFLSLVISSYRKEHKVETEFPEYMYGIPTYKNSVLSRPFSSTGNPYIYVFLTKDKVQDIVAFYSERLKIQPKIIKYNRGNMTIYQYELAIEDEALREEIKKLNISNYIFRGVEIMPLNQLYRKVYNYNTKIRIIVPKAQVVKLEAGQN